MDSILVQPFPDSTVKLNLQQFYLEAAANSCNVMRLSENGVLVTACRIAWGLWAFWGPAASSSQPEAGGLNSLPSLWQERDLLKTEAEASGGWLVFKNTNVVFCFTKISREYAFH